jgi:hypothetical protein
MITSRFSSVVAAVFEYGSEYRVVVDDAVVGHYKSKDDALDALVMAIDNVEA